MKEIKLYLQASHCSYGRGFAILSLVLIILFETLVVNVQSIPKQWDYEFTMDKRLTQVRTMPEGQFVRLGKERILSVSSESGPDVLISEDSGKTWKTRQIFKNPEKYKLGSTAVHRTDDGIVILAFCNLAERYWDSSDELKDASGTILPTYVVRSLDNGLFLIYSMN